MHYISYYNKYISFIKKHKQHIMVEENIIKQIDDLFLKQSTNPPIKLIDNINNIKEFKLPLNEQLKNVKEIHEYIQDDISRLNNLNSQIESLNEKNQNLEIIINNNKKLYKELKELLMKIEIKPKYYVLLEELEIKKENIEKLEISLYKTKYLKENLKLKVIEKRNETCKKYRLIFNNRFKIFFTSLLKELILNTLKNKGNKYDLKINVEIYEGLKIYSNLFINKLELRIIYGNEISKLFYSNFKFFFRTLIDIFRKSNKESFKDINDIFKSVLLISECEIKFIFSVFLEKDELSLDEEINVIFREAIPLFFVFLEEIFVIDELETLKAIQKIIKYSTNKDSYKEINAEYGHNKQNTLDSNRNSTTIDNHKKTNVKDTDKDLNAIKDFTESILIDLKSKYNSFELQYFNKLTKEFSNIKIRKWCFDVKELLIILINEDFQQKLKGIAIENIERYKKDSKIENLLERYICLNIIFKNDESIYGDLFVEIEKLFIELIINKDISKIKISEKKIKGIKEDEVRNKLKETLKKILIENKSLKNEFKWLIS